MIRWYHWQGVPCPILIYHWQCKGHQSFIGGWWLFIHWWVVSHCVGSHGSIGSISHRWQVSNIICYSVVGGGVVISFRWYLLPYNHTLFVDVQSHVNKFMAMADNTFICHSVVCLIPLAVVGNDYVISIHLYLSVVVYLIQHSGSITLQRMALLHICVTFGGVVCMAVITALKYIYSPLSFGGGVGGVVGTWQHIPS